MQDCLLDPAWSDLTRRLRFDRDNDLSCLFNSRLGLSRRGSRERHLPLASIRIRFELRRLSRVEANTDSMNADLRHLLAITKGHVSQTQLLIDLLGRMPCSLHLKESFPGHARSTILSIRMARLKGPWPFGPLPGFLDHLVDQRFVRPEYRDCFCGSRCRRSVVGNGGSPAFESAEVNRSLRDLKTPNAQVLCPLSLGLASS